MSYDRPMRILRGALVGGCVAWALACGSSDDDGGGAGSAGNYVATCDKLCQKVNQCDSTRDVDTCSNLCQNELASIGPKLSAAYLAAVDQCVQDATCGELVIAAVTDACDTEARSKIAATSAAERLCESAKSAAEECSRLALPDAACINGVKVFADSPLNAAESCFDSSCDQHAACVAGELGVKIEDL